MSAAHLSINLYFQTLSLLSSRIYIINLGTLTYSVGSLCHLCLFFPPGCRFEFPCCLFLVYLVLLGRFCLLTSHSIPLLGPSYHSVFGLSVRSFLVYQLSRFTMVTLLILLPLYNDRTSESGNRSRQS